VAAGIERFSTPRLLAERETSDHLDLLAALFADERVTATLGGVRSRAESAARLAEDLAHWDRHGYGFWIWRERAGGAFVGRAGLRHLEIGGGPEIELGYAVAAEHWGRGFATEASIAIVERAFDAIGLDDLVCFTQPTNAGSRRVMEKAGFVFEREVEHAGLPHLLHRQRRA